MLVALLSSIFSLLLGLSNLLLFFFFELLSSLIDLFKVLLHILHVIRGKLGLFLVLCLYLLLRLRVVF